MNYCLSKKEFHFFFESFISKHSLENAFDEDLQMRIDACMNWEDNVGIMLYLFTHFLQRKAKINADDNSDYIEQLFRLNELGSFIIEPMDKDFINYMLNYNRSKITEDLSDSLVLILQNYLDHSYDSSFCF